MITGEIVCQDYEIIQKIGEGSFGYVYKIKHRITKEIYSLKTDQKSTTKQQLQNEQKVLQKIKNLENYSNHKLTSKGYLSKSIRFIPSPDTYNMLIMPLYGQNLYCLFELCQRRFDSHTIHQVACSILQNIQYLHKLGFIHRDVKLQNFVIGSVTSQKQGFNTKQSMIEDDNIYMIDFGLSKEYIENTQNKQNSIESAEHVQYEIGRKIRGTPMYMSINVLLGIEPSRRDDIQAFMYVVILLIKGRIPWNNFKMDKKQFNLLLKTRLSITPAELFVDLPKQLLQIYIYIRNLEFQEQPNYDRIFLALESIWHYKRPRIQNEYNGNYRKYCWEVCQRKQKSEKQLNKTKQMKITD